MSLRLRRLRLDVAMRGLVTLVVWRSRVDEAIRTDAAGLPEGFVARFEVWPAGPRVGVARTPDGRLRLARDAEPASLIIRFKHLRHAEAVFLLRDTTPRAVAEDRVVIDGATDHAMRVQRIIDAVLAALVPAALLPDSLREDA
jgi:hypothetical protein